MKKLGLIIYLLSLNVIILTPKIALAKCLWLAEDPPCQKVSVDILNCKRYEPLDKLVKESKYREISKEMYPQNTLEISSERPNLNLYVKIESAKSAKCASLEEASKDESTKIKTPNEPVLLSLASDNLTCEEIGKKRILHIERPCCDTGQCKYYAYASLVP